MRPAVLKILFALIALAGLGQPTIAHQETSGKPPRARFIHEPWSARPQAEPNDSGQPSAPRYGQEGFRSYVVGFSSAYQGEAFDQGFTFSYNQFIVDDIEWLLEAGLWSFYEQGGDSAFGLSASLGFRWHFVTKESWSLFADLGIGMLGTTDTVPPDGTSFNFMPRVGVGFTRQLDENVRLIGGLRWHHISNARTRGDDRNPSRDAALIYLGLVIPF
mgnify:CR=1 FL=1